MSKKLDIYNEESHNKNREQLEDKAETDDETYGCSEFRGSKVLKFGYIMNKERYSRAASLRLP